MRPSRLRTLRRERRSQARPRRAPVARPTSSACRLRGDEALAVRPARAPVAAVHALGRARDTCSAPVFVAGRLPGRTVAAPATSGRLLGLRPPRAHRHAGRERGRRRRSRPRVLTALRGTLSDPKHASDRRVPRTRRACHSRPTTPPSFNCRYAVAPGPKRWSVHAYGRAVDVNPIENPYVEGGRVHPQERPRLPEPGSSATRDGRTRRIARARVRRGRLVLGRSLDGHARLPALLRHRRLGIAGRAGAAA